MTGTRKDGILPMPLNKPQRWVLTAILAFEQGRSEQEVAATVAKTHNYLTPEEVDAIVLDAKQRRMFGRAVSAFNAEGTLGQYTSINFDDSGERFAEVRIEWIDPNGKRQFATVRPRYTPEMTPQELQEEAAKHAEEMLKKQEGKRTRSAESGPEDGVFTITIIALL